MRRLGMPFDCFLGIRRVDRLPPAFRIEPPWLGNLFDPDVEIFAFALVNFGLRGHFSRM